MLEKVFKDKVATPAWQEKLHQIVPSYGTKLNESPERVAQEWAYTSEVLQLDEAATEAALQQTGARSREAAGSRLWRAA